MSASSPKTLSIGTLLMKVLNDKADIHNQITVKLYKKLSFIKTHLGYIYFTIKL